MFERGRGEVVRGENAGRARVFLGTGPIEIAERRNRISLSVQCRAVVKPQKKILFRTDLAKMVALTAQDNPDPTVGSIDVLARDAVDDVRCRGSSKRVGVSCDRPSAINSRETPLRDTPSVALPIQVSVV